MGLSVINHNLPLTAQLKQMMPCTKHTVAVLSVKSVTLSHFLSRFSQLVYEAVVIFY